MLTALLDRTAARAYGQGQKATGGVGPSVRAQVALRSVWDELEFAREETSGV